MGIVLKVLLVATVQSHICQFHKPLMKLLKENGYEVHVAARDNLAEKNGLAMEYADKVFNIPFTRSPITKDNISAYKRLKQIVKDNDYNIIHCNTPMGGMITRLVANKYRKKNGTKVFYTAHGFHFYEGAPKKNWLIYYPIEKFSSRLTDKLITITKEDYNLAHKKFRCQVEYIHGVGANSSKYYAFSDEEKKEIRKELGISEDTKVIVNVGELLPNKNQKTAILAMKKVVSTYPNTKLFIAGNGPELDNLTNLVKENGLENNVEFLGYTLELNKYFNVADCLVACSFREGLPLNVIEAMLCGNAVVASNNRGHRELVENGVNGFIVEPKDIDAFADKVIKVLDNTSIYTKSALKKAQLFTSKNVVEELKKIYSL